MIADFLDATPGWGRRRDQQRDGTVLDGRVVVGDRAGFTNWFDLELFVPASFPKPGAHPEAKIMDHDLERDLRADAHTCVGDVLCVQMNDRNEIDYAKGGLIAFFQQVVIHLHRARTWALTTKYPGPEYAHDGEGRREYQAEVSQLRAPWTALKEGLRPGVQALADDTQRLPGARSACPCGSLVPFRECCQPIVKQRRQQWRDLGQPPRIPMNNNRTAVMLAELASFLRRGGRK